MPSFVLAGSLLIRGNEDQHVHKVRHEYCTVTRAETMYTVSKELPLTSDGRTDRQTDRQLFYNESVKMRFSLSLSKLVS